VNTVTVTFGMPIVGPQGQMANMNMVFEQVEEYAMTDGLLDMKIADGRRVVWPLQSLRFIIVDPHGSIVKPQPNLAVR